MATLETECALCNRSFPPKQLTEHHCKPREYGGDRTGIALLCRQCHGMVHATYANATLALAYPTLGRLRVAPELQTFLRWVRRQDSARVKRNKPRRRKV